MAVEYDLFSKTFDQQIHGKKAKSSATDFAPNKRIPAEVIFEPIQNGLRVTARDSEHRVLWGFIASQGMLFQTHCPVAVYEALRELLTNELKVLGLPGPEESIDPIDDAKKSIEALEKTVAQLRESIDVKKVTPATVARAKAIRQTADDANRQITLELNISG